MKKMSQAESHSSDRIVEIPTPPLNLAEATDIAKKLVGQAFYVCRKTKSIAATIEAIGVKNELFICSLIVTDPDLEDNFYDDHYVATFFTEIDFSGIFTQQ